LDGRRSAWKRDGSGHAISRWLPEGTEDDVATKPVPAGCFARRATGLVEGRRLEKPDVAVGPELSGRCAEQGPAGEPAPRRDSKIRE